MGPALKAALLSLLVMSGLGSILGGRYIRGLALLVIETFVFIAIIGFGLYNFNAAFNAVAPSLASKDLGHIISLISAQMIRQGVLWLVVLLALLAGLRVLGAIWAFRDARQPPGGEVS